MDKIDRPLDFLNYLKGKSVIVERRGERGAITGILLAFDIHLNLVVECKEKTKFIRGDAIETVYPSD